MSDTAKSLSGAVETEKNDCNMLTSIAHTRWHGSYNWLMEDFSWFYRTLRLPAFSVAFLLSVIPKFLRPGGLRAYRKLHSTAYLDAVRGYAAVVVANHHFFEDYKFFWSKPFIGIIGQGRVMVDIFFIISGYVLTCRTLDYARQRKEADVARNLASATFRRFLRLFLPCILMTLINTVLVYTRNIRLHTAQPLDSLPAQFVDWIRDMVQFCNPFAPVRGYSGDGLRFSRYNHSLWTIPVELRGSLLVFLFCLACFRMTPVRRGVCCWILIVSSMVWNSTESALFLYGVFLAELSFEKNKGENALPTLPITKSHHFLPRRVTRMRRVWKRCSSVLIPGIAIILGWFLACEPQSIGPETPKTWKFLSMIIPSWWPQVDELRKHFWSSISAALILYGLENGRLYQRPFEFPFSQYIGQISFGIYIMHVPVIGASWLLRLFASMKNSLGDNYPCAVIRYIIFLFVLIWLADMFTRLDKRIMAFTRWLEGQVLAKSPDNISSM
ncbi:hypothetical protein ANO11243_072070 [Dothideomycetidae sp. 11243]|nr:hypothetical protein ANO11243_072070 [fungal sp. No.11243]